MMEFHYFTSPTCWALFGCSMLATILLMPVVMWFAHRIDAVDRGGYRKVYKGAMPLLGGLSIAIPFIAVCILGILEPTSMFGSIRGMHSALLVLAVGAAAIACVGIYDDTRGMRARTKLLFQTGVALFVCFSGHAVRSLDLPFLGAIELGPVFGSFFTVLWIVGIINAFNLIDGVDGLAAGVALFCTLGLAVLAAMGGWTFVALLCLALSGSLFAFLLFNFHPARIFLGDTGSMLLGFLLACIALMGSFKTQTATLFVAPILVLGMPIFETVVSMIRRHLRGHSIFAGDNLHTHHRLLRRGYTQRQTVLTLYAASILFACSAIVLALPRHQQAGAPWIALGFCLAAIGWILWSAGYFDQMQATELFRRRRRNHLFSAFSRYAHMSLHAQQNVVSADDILSIGRMQLGLNVLQVWFKTGPTLLGSSGTQNEWAKCPVEKIEVQNAEGQGIVILYQHEQAPSEAEHHDVAACLASIFDQCEIQVPRLPAAADPREKSPASGSSYSQASYSRFHERTAPDLLTGFTEEGLLG